MNAFQLYHNPGVPPRIILLWHTKHGDNQPCFSGQLLSMFILSSLNNKLFHCLSLSGLLSCACFTCGLTLPCSEWSRMKPWVASRECNQGFRGMKLNTPTLNIFCGFLVHNSDYFQFKFWLFSSNSFKSFVSFLWWYPTNSVKIKLHLSWAMLTKETRIISPLDGATISNKAAGCLKISLKYILWCPMRKDHSEESWLQ